MSEEEIIEILEDKDMFIDTLYENYRQSIVKPFEKALQGLLDLYNKEKEENRKLRKCHLMYEEMTGVDLLLEEDNK